MFSYFNSVTELDRNANILLYPPSERSELARYHVMLFSFRLSVHPSICPSVHNQYLDANISKTV